MLHPPTLQTAFPSWPRGAISNKRRNSIFVPSFRSILNVKWEDKPSRWKSLLWTYVRLFPYCSRCYQVLQTCWHEMSSEGLTVASHCGCYGWSGSRQEKAGPSPLALKGQREDEPRVVESYLNYRTHDRTRGHLISYLAVKQPPRRLEQGNVDSSNWLPTIERHQRPDLAPGTTTESNCHFCARSNMPLPTWSACKAIAKSVDVFCRSCSPRVERLS